MTRLKKVASLLRLRPHTNSKKVATTTGKKKSDQQRSPKSQTRKRKLISWNQLRLQTKIPKSHKTNKLNTHNHLINSKKNTNPLLLTAQK